MRWQDQVYDLLRQHNVTQFAYVPDAGHRILIDRSLADPDVHSVALTTEEEGVALLAGADLGGARGVLLMQSSGVGQLHQHALAHQGRRLPVSHARSACAASSARAIRGSSRWARPPQPVLEAMGVICLRSESPQDVLATVGAALTMTFQAGNAVAVLFTQKLLGAKKF